MAGHSDPGDEKIVLTPLSRSTSRIASAAGTVSGTAPTRGPSIVIILYPSPPCPPSHQGRGGGRGPEQFRSSCLPLPPGARGNCAGGHLHSRAGRLRFRHLARGDYNPATPALTPLPPGGGGVGGEGVYRLPNTRPRARTASGAPSTRMVPSFSARSRSTRPQTRRRNVSVGRVSVTSAGPESKRATWAVPSRQMTLTGPPPGPVSSQR